MVIQVNQEICTGCGVCVDACSVGAIHLVNQRAEIDDALCTACKACLEACSNGAIVARSTLEPDLPIITLPMTATRPSLVLDQDQLSEATAPARGLAPLAGAALAFLGREVAPRLIDVLISTLERKLTQPTTTAVAPLSTSARSLTQQNKGQRRQARYRGGQPGIINLKERR
jgi:Fe-S-cluster-containing hydrogenase component 2